MMTEDWNALLAAEGMSPDPAYAGPALDDAALQHPLLAVLPDLGLIRATGPDTADFLHNLMTNDVKGIGPGNARVAGLCTAKGRLLATPLVWRDGEDFLLLVPQDILPPLLKKLTMYVLRAKVKLSDASGERVLLGCTFPTGAVPPASTFGADIAALPDRGVVPVRGGQAIRLDRERWLLCLGQADAAGVWPALRRGATLVGPEAWRLLEIRAGQPRVVAATQEAFVPQMLNMELPEVGGVSFTKGCYPGQEIVARTQYLGKVKRRMHRARLPAGLAAGPGLPLFAPETGDQQCGTVVTTAAGPDGRLEALVCVQAGAVAGGRVECGTPGGPPLDLLDLPYPLPD